MNDNIYYVGMDVHKAITVIVVLNYLGQEIMRTVVQTKSDTILAVVKALNGEVRVTFEEGISSAWLYDLLTPHVREVLVCNPRKNKRTSSDNKSDDIDAADLAERMRLGALKKVYKGEQGMRKLKELARSYLYLVSDCTRIKNRIKAIYRARAIEYKREDIYEAAERQHWLAKLVEEGARARAQRLLEELDALMPICRRAEQEMVREARKHKGFKLLDSVPMLGPIRVALILAIAMTPHRFRTKRQFWTYIGFSVVTSSTADYEVVAGKIKKTKKKSLTRGLNQNFNRTLKNVFKSAANAVRSGIMKDYYEGLIEKGTNEQMARLTLARKIAAIALTVWKKGELFRAEKFLKQTV
jgi:transposase